MNKLSKSQCMKLREPLTILATSFLSSVLMTTELSGCGLIVKRGLFFFGFILVPMPLTDLLASVFCRFYGPDPVVFSSLIPGALRQVEPPGFLCVEAHTFYLNIPP